MTVEQDNARGPDGSELSAELGPALEGAAEACLMALAGVETHNVDLRDHPEAWAAIEAFAAKVQAAERERGAKLAAWLQWCLENCDDCAEWNFGTTATEHMRALLAGGDAPMPGA